MNNTTVIRFLAVTCLVTVFSNSFADDNKAPASVESFYKDMSAFALVYALRVVELENDASKRQVILKRLSRQVFTYWYETRHLGAERSRKVETACRFVYSKYKPPGNEGGVVEAIFDDPLQGLVRSRKPKTKKHWKFSSREEYQILLKVYKSFLSEEASDEGGEPTLESEKGGRTK